VGAAQASFLVAMAMASHIYDADRFRATAQRDVSASSWTVAVDARQ
jgi:hypothetical protein